MSPTDFNMTCSQVRAALADYLEEVPMGQSREVMREHLASCPDCRRALEEERELLAALATLKRISAPPGFAKRTLALILPPAVSGRVLLPRLIRGMAIASALFLLIMILIRFAAPAGPEIPSGLVDTAALTALEHSAEIGDGFRTVGRATSWFSDALEPFRVLGRASSVVMGNLPPTVVGLALLGALLPPFLIITIVLRYRLKGMAQHAR